MQPFGLRRGLGQRLTCRSAVPFHTAHPLRPLLNIHGNLLHAQATSGSSDGAGSPAPSQPGAEPSRTADAARAAEPASAAQSTVSDGVSTPAASSMTGSARGAKDDQPAPAAAAPASSLPSASPSDISDGAAVAAATTTVDKAPSASSASASGSNTATTTTTAAANGAGSSPLPSASVTPMSASPSSLPPFVQQLLNWLLSVLTALEKFPAWVQLQHLRRLREACEEDPADADKHAAYLAELVRSNPREVVARVESRRFGVNAAVVAEYLRALVETGRVAELVKGDAAAAAASASAAAAAAAAAADAVPARTLSELLRDLQEQLTTAAGDASIPGNSAAANLGALGSGAVSGQAATGGGVGDLPGTSLRRPLHVVVSGLPPGFLQAAATAAGPSPAPSSSSSLPLFLRPLALLWRLISMAVVILVLAVVYLIGTQAIRRVQASGGAVVSPTAVSAGPPVTAAGGATAGSSSTSNAGGGGPSVEPKEYKKDELPEKSIRTFKDVKGCDEAKEELREVVEFLKNPTKFTRLGAKLPKGVLLTGPPGTGKTLLAKAVAGEAGVPFFYRAGSEFEELYVGVGSRRMRALFAAAKKRAPCIVFIDEIDAIGGNRKAWENHSRKTLNQLLVEMDGFESTEGVIVMAATNLAESLDPALKRPGRFDRQVAVPLPDIKGRRDILEYYLHDKPLGADVNRELMARQTQGFSGADLSNLINEGAILAAKEGSEIITQRMFDWAYDKILMGVERKSVKRTLEARRRTAFHEAGHALVALCTPGASPIHKATIVPRGHALGMVTQVGRDDEFSINRQQMLARIWVCMGGTVAEELVFGSDQVSSGATDDLKQATSLARHMVAECGMSPAIGPVYVAAHDERHGGAGVSEATRQRVDVEVAALLADAKEGVRGLLSERMQDLRILAEALLDRETLNRQEINALLQLDDKEDAGSNSGGGGGSGGGGSGGDNGNGRHRGDPEDSRLEDEPAASPAPVAAAVPSTSTSMDSTTAASESGEGGAVAAAVVVEVATGGAVRSCAAADPAVSSPTAHCASSKPSSGDGAGEGAGLVGANDSPTSTAMTASTASPPESKEATAQGGNPTAATGWANWYDTFNRTAAEAGAAAASTAAAAAVAPPATRAVTVAAAAADQRTGAEASDNDAALPIVPRGSSAAEICVESEEFGLEGSLVGLGVNALAAAAVTEVMDIPVVRTLSGQSSGGQDHRNSRNSSSW